MKNYEKYADEIREKIGKNEGKYFCSEFIRPYILKSDSCGGYMTCDACCMRQMVWLLEEYEEPKEPEVDWSKVTVDTLVRVRDYESDEWTLRYFKGLSSTPSAYPPGYDYEVWALGATSVTAEGDTEQWKYCELVED